MLDYLRGGLRRVGDLLAWAPPHLLAIVILLVAAAVALAIHRGVVRGVRRALRDRHPYVRSFLSGTQDLTRLALVVIALFIALPLTPLDSEIKGILARVLLLASIILVGWAAVAVVNMTADLYLLRFRLDVADNLLARKHLTQIRVLTRAVNTLLIIATIAAALMTFEAVRQYGISLFASAGVAGLIAGFAARPVLSNLFAGIQIAIAQPIRINDLVFIENEFGRIEEITATYVVIELWDLRRMIVPLSYFIEKPIQNWTRQSGALIGTVLLYVDYSTPVERVRTKLNEIVKDSPRWDGKVLALQVTDAKQSTMELRVIASAHTAGDAFDLRCEIREKLIAFLQREIPTALPRMRQEVMKPEALPSPADDERHPPPSS